MRHSGGGGLLKRGPGNERDSVNRKGELALTFEKLPFSAYPGSGREQLKRGPGLISRYPEGPEFMRITGAKHSAFFGLSTTAGFEDWLTMALDHVVPQSVCKNMGIDNDCVTSQRGCWQRAEQ